MSVLHIKSTAGVVRPAIVRRAEAHEPVLEGVVSAFVPVVVTYNVLLACEPLLDYYGYGNERSLQ